MRILIVADAFWPDHIGGITKSLLTETENLMARGHQITVVARRLKGDSPSYEERTGYHIYRYWSPASDSVFYRIYPLFTLMQLPKLVYRLRNHNFDVIYVHNSFQIQGLQRALPDTPVVCSFYAPMPLEIEIDAKGRKYGFLSRFAIFVAHFLGKMEAKALYGSDVIVARSYFMKGELHRLYRGIEPSKVVVVPLGVDIHRFNVPENQREIRRSLGLPENRTILLTVRRLVARMGLENLIDAMQLVIKHHPEVLLLIGGRGYLGKKLRERICLLRLEDYIQLLGFIPEEDLPRYYQAADLFVLPTAELEGFGLVTIEALSCGTPVIATPVGANPEVIGPLGQEFLCKDATTDAIAERILWWLERGISMEVRQACRDYCVSKFAAESVVASLEQVFTNATSTG